MQKWCLIHPWMTFFIIIFTIFLLYLLFLKLIKGKSKCMENLSIKGGIKMPNNQNNSNNSGTNNSGSSGRTEHKDYGTLRVPPTSAPPPPPPPKQD